MSAVLDARAHGIETIGPNDLAGAVLVRRREAKRRRSDREDRDLIAAGAHGDHGIDAAERRRGAVDQSLQIIGALRRTGHAHAVQLGGERLGTARRRHQREPVAPGMEFAGDGGTHAAATRRDHGYGRLHRGGGQFFRSRTVPEPDSMSMRPRPSPMRPAR